ncbi:MULTISPECIES: hypothetical protein [Mycobacteriaceae]|uniref:hypothetical protein n=1 Tax=Mycobacteriaceae TaxID=1762 RepID=UPI000928A177|nr:MULTISPECIES: hypothetical protein [Mycobacteriaceae]MCX8556207.1 hypothetical protein [Mycolicibacterium mucogenicum]SHU94985.1 Uncharacterised protein [Mycobacteroides abscessus subsp. abscessus]SHU98416.1 Uncharacterised protein [Mycobacteroides abscessus subsp. abscessus]SHV60392.1 Uncharacterised protein [Mycobacteroides abscessus subsp. abscessus]SHV82095.1 Uncharacterised protein [Mycobacteroides abscessus subsp. abscessus]
MADLTRLDDVVLDPTQILAFGTGGAGRARRVYRDGAATDEPVLVDGAQLHRLTGLAVSVAGIGLDGAEVQTTTPLDTVPAGTLFRAEGRCTLSVRAEGKSGWNGGAPRGVLVVTVYIQTLIPVGSVTELAKAGSGGRRGASE